MKIPQKQAAKDAAGRRAGLGSHGIDPGAFERCDTRSIGNAQAANKAVRDPGYAVFAARASACGAPA